LIIRDLVVELIVIFVGFKNSSLVLLGIRPYHAAVNTTATTVASTES